MGATQMEPLSDWVSDIEQKKSDSTNTAAVRLNACIGRNDSMAGFDKSREVGKPDKFVLKPIWTVSAASSGGRCNTCLKFTRWSLES
jgi:hypothetical protein